MWSSPEYSEKVQLQSCGRRTGKLAYHRTIKTHLVRFDESSFIISVINRSRISNLEIREASPNQLRKLNWFQMFSLFRNTLTELGRSMVRNYDQTCARIFILFHDAILSSREVSESVTAHKSIRSQVTTKSFRSAEILGRLNVSSVLVGVILKANVVFVAPKDDGRINYPRYSVERKPATRMGQFLPILEAFRPVKWKISSIGTSFCFFWQLFYDR